ncbi:hypothetical protein [Chitinophaga rhizosphaerae]|uniref:hypothetical protein n=1 Tax=Chitinophaga rhizosphaerae TaxID=1864947 RepID=UPI000F7FECFD|nr:hypothetical protein [Chitinophaga rhizosphaerae]
MRKDITLSVVQENIVRIKKAAEMLCWQLDILEINRPIRAIQFSGLRSILKITSELELPINVVVEPTIPNEKSLAKVLSILDASEIFVNHLQKFHCQVKMVVAVMSDQRHPKFSLEDFSHGGLQQWYSWYNLNVEKMIAIHDGFRKSSYQRGAPDFLTWYQLELYRMKKMADCILAKINMLSEQKHFHIPELEMEIKPMMNLFMELLYPIEEVIYDMLHFEMLSKIHDPFIIITPSEIDQDLIEFMPRLDFIFNLFQSPLGEIDESVLREGLKVKGWFEDTCVKLRKIKMILSDFGSSGSMVP